MRARHTVDGRQVTAISLLAVVGLLVVSLPGEALAKGHPPVVRASKKDVHACGVVYEKAKARAQEAHLREAKEMLGLCARATCGSFLQQECTTLYTQLDADIPSVVPVVTDDTGVPHSLVEVRMDGELLTSKLDGHALPVDPGKHVFSFSTDAGVFATQKIMIVQGQRNRPISVVLHVKKKGDQPIAGSPEAAGAPVAEGDAATPKSAEAAAAGAEAVAPQEVDTEEGSEPRRVETVVVTRPRRRVVTTWPTYTLAGVGVAAVGAAGLLTYWGRKDNNALSACAPSCSPSSLDHIRKLYTIADISAGVGVAALVAATWLYVRAHTADDEEPAPRTTAHLQMLDLRPTQSGAFATVGGSF